jgi:hypothetical protein
MKIFFILIFICTLTPFWVQAICETHKETLSDGSVRVSTVCREGDGTSQHHAESKIQVFAQGSPTKCGYFFQVM